MPRSPGAAQIAVVLTHEERDRLHALAQVEGVSAARWVRNAIARAWSAESSKEKAQNATKRSRA